MWDRQLSCSGELSVWQKNTRQSWQIKKRLTLENCFCKCCSFEGLQGTRTIKAKDTVYKKQACCTQTSKAFSSTLYFLEYSNTCINPSAPCTKLRAWLHEVPGLTEDIFLKTLSVAQPLLGGLANNGAVGKVPHKALFAPLSNMTVAFLPHHCVMWDSVAAWPLPGADSVCCKGSLGFENKISRDIEAGTYADEFSHMFRRMPRHFRRTLFSPNCEL